MRGTMFSMTNGGGANVGGPGSLGATNGSSGSCNNSIIMMRSESNYHVSGDFT